MASKNIVEIDWSTTTGNYFARADAYTRSPVADLYNYKPCHIISNNVLTTKDILAYDIDIYLKFHERSLPSEELLSSPILSDEDEIALTSSTPIFTTCDEDIPMDIIPDTTPSTVITASSSLVDKDSPPVSYELLEPYSQLDSSDDGRIIPKGRLAENIVSDTTTTPEDSTFSTIADTLLAHIPSPLTFSFLVSFEHFHVTAASKAVRSSVASTSQSSVVTSNPIIAISPTLKVDVPVFTPTKKVQPKGHKVPPNILPILEELLPYAPDVPIYKDGVTFENLTKAE
ncbi:hypothetical protein RhiirA4_428048 [Rhizophagus irregularis]|uniref:Uncharacterized protein n=1 Tax=Rhizophagus irregularis TaxID=588596 RepID=A0A2I1HBA3_9GLOM|nr:hypothetical protein RhiirA4_428048 [Rhizophagus irregularis]